MYNILELSAKTLDQLKVIAAEMGIQKIDGIEQEDLNLRKIKRSLYLKNRMN